VQTVSEKEERGEEGEEEYNFFPFLSSSSCVPFQYPSFFLSLSRDAKFLLFKIQIGAI